MSSFLFYIIILLLKNKMQSLKNNNYKRIIKEINEHNKSEYYNKLFGLEIVNDDLSKLIVTLKGCEHSIY